MEHPLQIVIQFRTSIKMRKVSTISNLVASHSWYSNTVAAWNSQALPLAHKRIKNS